MTLDKLNLTTDGDLARKFSIPKGTVSTWHTRETTPFEISIRAHLATGLSLRWLLLDEGDAFPEQIIASDSNSVMLEQFQVRTGELHSLDKISFDRKLFLELTSGNAIAINDVNCIYLINTDDRKVISGKYLASMDGLISLNDLQKLPGGKLLMSFNGSNVEIGEDQLEVRGKVVSRITKE
jgi:CI repressor-like protein